MMGEILHLSEYAKQKKRNRSSIYRWINQGFPTYKSGGLTLVDVDKADEWIAAYKKAVGDKKKTQKKTNQKRG